MESNRKLRLIEHICEFNCYPIYIQGKDNKLADFLSRFMLTQHKMNNKSDSEYTPTDTEFEFSDNSHELKTLNRMNDNLNTKINNHNFLEIHNIENVLDNIIEIIEINQKNQNNLNELKISIHDKNEMLNYSSFSSDLLNLSKSLTYQIDCLSLEIQKFKIIYFKLIFISFKSIKQSFHNLTNSFLLYPL